MSAALLLLQLATILFVARLFVIALKRLGKPVVIGDRVAGLLQSLLDRPLQPEGANGAPTRQGPRT